MCWREIKPRGNVSTWRSHRQKHQVKYAFVSISTPRSSADVSERPLQNLEIKFVSWQFTWTNYTNGISYGELLWAKICGTWTWVWVCLQNLIKYSRGVCLFSTWGTGNPCAISVGLSGKSSSSTSLITTFSSCRCTAGLASQGGPST